MSNSDYYLKDALLTANNIVRQSLKSGQEIGERDAAAKAQPLLDALIAEAALLRAWAVESREGGWSTHQVDPMRRRANDLDMIIAAYRREK